MRLLVAAETREGERRVAVLPETVSKLTGLGFEVSVQAGAGKYAFAPDQAYAEASATIVADDQIGAAMAAADVIATVRPLDPDRIAGVKAGAILVSFCQPAIDLDVVLAAREAKATLLSFDMLPRISRAQSMDALSSQALVTGYRAALVGADLLPRFYPLFMTAAGTIQAAKVLVLGAGVAGLQAIATAKRLGAIVSANDVRAASADEVRSMGAKFIDLSLQAEGSGGYAKEMGVDAAKHQQELLTPHVTASDVVITTAAIPGRTAPRLVTAEMVATMKPGSVLVDLAAETGGNVEGSVPGEVVRQGEVTIWGGKDVASQMPVHASQLYGMNIVNLLKLTVKDGQATVDTGDEILDGCAVVLDGTIRSERALEALGRKEQ